MKENFSWFEKDPHTNLDRRMRDAMIIVDLKRRLERSPSSGLHKVTLSNLDQLATTEAAQKLDELNLPIIIFSTIPVVEIDYNDSPRSASTYEVKRHRRPTKIQQLFRRLSPKR